MDWWTQGEKKVIVGLLESRRSGRWVRRFRAKIVPEEWEAMWTCGIWRWVSRAGTVSRKMGIRWDIGTGEEAPKPGLCELLA